MLFRSLNFQPDVAVINTAFPSIYNDLSMASEIKSQAPHCKTIVFGIFPTLLPKEVFKINPEVDFAIIGERSEEHTSELQSHSFISYAVFCLKKKTIRKIGRAHLRTPLTFLTT